MWKPGTRYGYHPMTFGWLVGEVIRRVSGESVGAFFRRRVADPLGIYFWIGLPQALEGRVAPSVGIDGGSPSKVVEAAAASGDPIATRVRNADGGFLASGGCNTRGEAHAAEIPAANGITNALGLAGLYAPLSLGGTYDDVHVVDEGQLAQMIATESSSMCDAVLARPLRHSAGFEKAAPGRAALAPDGGYLLSEAAFGHSGYGGAMGFADLEARLAFGYVMNRHPGAGEAPGGTETSRSSMLSTARSGTVTHLPASGSPRRPGARARRASRSAPLSNRCFLGYTGKPLKVVEVRGRAENREAKKPRPGGSQAGRNGLSDRAPVVVDLAGHSAFPKLNVDGHVAAPPESASRAIGAMPRRLERHGKHPGAVVQGEREPRFPAVDDV